MLHLNLDETKLNFCSTGKRSKFVNYFIIIINYFLV